MRTNMGSLFLTDVKNHLLTFVMKEAPNQIVAGESTFPRMLRKFDSALYYLWPLKPTLISKITVFSFQFSSK